MSIPRINLIPQSILFHSIEQPRVQFVNSLEKKSTRSNSEVRKLPGTNDLFHVFSRVWRQRFCKMHELRRVCPRSSIVSTTCYNLRETYGARSSSLRTDARPRNFSSPPYEIVTQTRISMEPIVWPVRQGKTHTFA